VSIRKRIASFRYALKGIRTLVMTQANARIHLIFVILVALAGWYFNIEKYEWYWVITACVMVLAAEAFNTAIEFIVDMVSPEYHPLAEKAKDVAAAAVLITAIGAAILGLLIFLPKFSFL
jgi:diacylglycerol kinase (ATP)